jgi:hypothetical protein
MLELLGERLEAAMAKTRNLECRRCCGEQPLP